MTVYIKSGTHGLPFTSILFAVPILYFSWTEYKSQKYLPDEALYVHPEGIHIYYFLHKLFLNL